MSEAIILSAGQGSKIWPYSVVRPKSLIPISNNPILLHQIRALKKLGVQKIIVAAHPLLQSYKNLVCDIEGVQLLDVGNTKGTGQTLSKALHHVKNEYVTVLYGDVIVNEADLKKIVEPNHDKKNLVSLLSPHTETPRNYIGCTIKDDRIDEIIGHSRESTTHHFLGFYLPVSIKDALDHAAPYFPKVEVGMMPPEEVFIEAALKDHGELMAAVCDHKTFDIDKPWHILDCNRWMNEKICSSLIESSIHDSSSVSPKAHIEGLIRLGEGSTIGSNVVIEGNVWVGDHTEIKYGAVLKGNNVIGNNCEIGYNCFIDEGSTVGHGSKILKNAELSGVLFPGVYMYHYMEIAGIVGENSDVGAGTVSGTLRFDDSNALHRIKGRPEFVDSSYLANASYIGDFARTGINSMLMPGVKTGVRSIVGPGVLLNEDLEDDTMILNEQKLVKKPWTPDRYGW